MNRVIPLNPTTRLEVTSAPDLLAFTDGVIVTDSGRIELWSNEEITTDRPFTDGRTLCVSSERPPNYPWLLTVPQWIVWWMSGPAVNVWVEERPVTADARGWLTIAQCVLIGVAVASADRAFGGGAAGLATFALSIAGFVAALAYSAWLNRTGALRIAIRARPTPAAAAAAASETPWSPPPGRIPPPAADRDPRTEAPTGRKCGDDRPPRVVLRAAGPTTLPRQALTHRRSPATFYKRLTPAKTGAMVH